MIVVDAPALLESSCRRCSAGGSRRVSCETRDEFYTPHLIDVEVTQALSTTRSRREGSADRVADANRLPLLRLALSPNGDYITNWLSDGPWSQSPQPAASLSPSY